MDVLLHVDGGPPLWVLLFGIAGMVGLIGGIWTLLVLKLRRGGPGGE